MARIEYIIDATFSKFDKYGNRYSIVAITQTETGKTAEFFAGYGVFPYTSIVEWLGCEMSNCYLTSRSIPIREFNRRKTGLPDLTEETLKASFNTRPL